MKIAYCCENCGTTFSGKSMFRMTVEKRSFGKQEKTELLTSDLMFCENCFHDIFDIFSIPNNMTQLSGFPINLEEPPRWEERIEKVDNE